MATARAHRGPSPYQRRGLAALSALAVGVLLVTGAAVPAAAYAKPSLSDVEKQIDAVNNQLEPVVEDYNRIHGELVADQAKVVDLQKKLVPLQLSATTALAQLQPLIAQLYENGSHSTISLLISSDSSAELLNALSTIDTVTKTRHDRIAPVLAARDAYLSAKKDLDATISGLELQNADLAARKATIEAKLASLQKLRLQVYGENGPPLGNLRPVACPYTYIGGAAGIAARTACSEIGRPYVWAAAGPSYFDCSGLTLYAWARAGKTLRHYTGWQWEDGTPISRSQLQPGDLVFFYPGSLHHMGLYVGGGWMVHAPHTGDVVRMARIDSYPIAGYRRP